MLTGGCLRQVSWYFLFGSQDGVDSPEDIDTVLTDGLGMRYSILGPFEAIHLNANGMFCMHS